MITLKEKGRKMENRTVVANLKEKMSGISFKRIFVWTVLLLALSVNQASVYLTAFLWQFDPVFFLLGVFFVVLVFSLAIKDLRIAIILACIALVIGLVIGLITLIIPPIVSGQSYLIWHSADPYINYVGKLAVFGLIASLLAAVLGSLFSGYR